MTLDEVRKAFPDLGVALYAYTPGGTVTFEIITPSGETFTFTGNTVADALAVAFPPAPAPEPEAAIPATEQNQAPEPTPVQENIFD